MSSQDLLGPYFKRLEEFSSLRWVGRVTKAVGHLIESEGPYGSVGEGCGILTSDGQIYAGEIVGFRGRTVLSMPLERPVGIRYGDRIVSRGSRPSIPVGPGLLGRVVDGAGRPLDGKGAYRTRDHWPLIREAPLPLARTPIRRSDRMRNPRHRRIHHLRTGTARRNLWRQRRGKEHADRDDGARDLRGIDSPCAGGRTRPRSARLS